MSMNIHVTAYVNGAPADFDVEGFRSVFARGSLTEKGRLAERCDYLYLDGYVRFGDAERVSPSFSIDGAFGRIAFARLLEAVTLIGGMIVWPDAAALRLAVTSTAMLAHVPRIGEGEAAHPIVVTTVDQLVTALDFGSLTSKEAWNEWLRDDNYEMEGFETGRKFVGDEAVQRHSD